MQELLDTVLHIDYMLTIDTPFHKKHSRRFGRSEVNDLKFLGA